MQTIRFILFVLFLHSHAWAITIATGSPEGTYYKIAQDVKRLAEKEGIPVEIISTNGSFDNVNLLGAGKVDLAIVQLDVLKVVAEIMRKEAGFNVFEQAKVVLNLYPEEIHVITKNESIRSLYQLEGKKVAVGPEKSGSAMAAEVLLSGYDLRVEAFSMLRVRLSTNSITNRSMPSSLSAARRFPHSRISTRVSSS